MGGNIFKDKTKPIKIDNIESTVKRYFEELKGVFPLQKELFDKKYFKYVGSVGKKPESGDIDLAIDTSFILDDSYSAEQMHKWGLHPDDIHEQFLKYQKRARTATEKELMTRAVMKGIVDKINEEAPNIYCDTKKVGAGGIFGYFPQFTPDGDQLDYAVQIDWMVGNATWLEFSYYSESYKGNVKGLHRTQLILAMFDNLGMSFGHTRGVIDKETRDILASTPEEAIKLLEEGYSTTITKDIQQNFFKLIKVVDGLPDARKRREIIGTYFKILDKTRCDIPEMLQSEWLYRQGELKLTGKFLPRESRLIKFTLQPGNEYKVSMLDQDGIADYKLYANYVEERKGKGEGFKGKPGYLFEISRTDDDTGVEVGEDLWLPSEEGQWSYNLQAV